MQELVAEAIRARRRDRRRGRRLRLRRIVPARPAYRFSVEDSIYLDRQARGRGVGGPLLAPLIDDCERRGFRQMVAVIGNSAQTSSIELHRAAGFAWSERWERRLQVRPLARQRDACSARSGRRDTLP